MDLSEFQKLDPDEREPIIAKNGKFVDEIVYQGKAYRIISVFKFFVEFIYTDETFTNIHSVRSFAAGPQLDKYSQNLEDMINDI